MTTPTLLASLPLHRHQLVRLTDAGWRRLRDGAWDDEARACLEHWAMHRLPLVVTRQPPCADGANGTTLALGLAAPLQWGRRRMALSVPRDDIAGFDEFPSADRLAGRLPARLREPWRGLCASLATAGATARVYGSLGWECVSGLVHRHESSDIDVWIGVNGTAHADAVATALARFDPLAAPRLDGELLFTDGRAVAWREWQAWRAGRCRAILAKTLAGAALVEARAADADAMAEHAGW
jgi:phosphoribosyl-dephospho-CoA transferase